ncbi:MAG: NAD(P)/FAD-dependent oxidoreductase [Candidatus Altiarchaeota archaeon]
MYSKNIKIIGAGLSGLSAAVVLGKAGYNSIVYEKNSEVGHKFGRNICALRNYPGGDPLKEFRKLGLTVNSVSRTEQVVKMSPSFSRIMGRRRYYLLNTGGAKLALEQQLYADALSNGVKFYFNWDKPVNADINATGTPAEKANIYGTGFNYLDLNVEKDTLYLLYDNNIVPNGYAYVLSYGKHSTVMAVTFDKRKFSSLDEIFLKAIHMNQFLNKITKDATLVERVGGYGYYSKNPYSKAANGKQLLVGEAAGFQDASRGFGIRYAIISGALAAKSIIEKEDYVSLLKEYFKDEFEKNLERRKIHDTLINEDYDNSVGAMF